MDFKKIIVKLKLAIYITCITIILKIMLISKNKTNKKILLIEHLSISNIIISFSLMKVGYNVEIIRVENLSNKIKKKIYEIVYLILKIKMIKAIEKDFVNFEMAKYIYEGDILNTLNRIKNTENNFNNENQYERIKLEALKSINNFINNENICISKYNYIIIPEFFRVPYSTIARYLNSINKTVYIFDLDKVEPFNKLIIRQNSSILPEIK